MDFSFSEEQSMLRDLVREFPDAPASQAAGELARMEAVEAAAQRIQMTGAFLRENPRVAGLYGLGLQPELLDENLRNGEIHSEGVTFVGARTPISSTSCTVPACMNWTFEPEPKWPSRTRTDEITPRYWSKKESKMSA